MKKVKLFTNTLIASTLVLLALSPAIASAAVTVSITSPSNGSSNGSTFTVSGTASANRTISISVDGDEEATTASDGSGNWSANLSGLSAGDHDIEAIVTGDDIAFIPQLLPAGVRLLNLSDFTDRTIAGAQLAGGIAITSDHSRVFRTDLFLGNNGLYSMDTVGETEDSEVLLGAGFIFLSPDENTIYVIQSGDILVVDADTLTQTDTISLSGGALPASAAINSSGTRLYVGADDNNIHIVDLASNTDIGTFSIGVGNNVSNMEMDATGTRLYVGVTTSSNLFNVYNTSSDSVSLVSSTDMGVVQPYTIEVLSDENTAYVLNAVAAEIAVVDIASETVTDNITTGTTTTVVAIDSTSDDSRVYFIELGSLFGGCADGAVHYIDTSDNSMNTLESNAVCGIVAQDFISPEIATDSITISVSTTDGNSEDELADTGINQNILQRLAMAITIAGAIGLAWLTRRNRTA